MSRPRKRTLILLTVLVVALAGYGWFLATNHLSAAECYLVGRWIHDIDSRPNHEIAQELTFYPDRSMTSRFVGKNLIGESKVNRYRWHVSGGSLYFATREGWGAKLHTWVPLEWFGYSKSARGAYGFEPEGPDEMTLIQFGAERMKFTKVEDSKSPSGND